MKSYQDQWKAKQDEIFALQDTMEDNSEKITTLELEIHELMRLDWASPKA